MWGVVFTFDQLCPVTSSREIWGNWRGFCQYGQGPTAHVLERRKKLGLFNLVKRAQELFQSLPQLFGEMVTKVMESNVFW